jgi:twitching motility protein PilT
MRILPLDGERLARVVPALAACPLFAGLTQEQLGRVAAAAALAQFEPGEALMRTGEVSDSFDVIVGGRCGVRVPGPGGEADLREITQLATHDSVGEMGLILNRPRTADVIALERTIAVRFGAEVFRQLFEKLPAFGHAICRALAERLQGASRSLPMTDAPAYAPPTPEVADLLPLEFRRHHRVLPLASEGNRLTLGCVDDVTPRVIESVRQALPGMEVTAVRIRAEFFEAALFALEDAAPHDLPAQPTIAPASSPRLDALLRRVVAEGASDLHISARHRPRWRIDGEMRELSDQPPLRSEEVGQLLSPVMSEAQRAAFAADDDVDFAYALGDIARFRVNMFRDHHGIGAVLRQIPSKILTFEQLGLPPAVKALSDLPKGLVLVTGPTGSGKSTTLAAMVDAINRRKRAHIITLEDPIEFVHPSQASLVNQREVGPHTRSFARALRAALREDPDIVLVGEMRDLETISLAIETANTGHLVFGTLHTSTATSTVDRIINVFPHEQQAQIRATLSETLKGVVAQTLCRKQGGGRVAALEVLVVNAAVSNLIREGKTFQIASAMTTGRGLGNQLLNDELARLVQSGKVAYDEAHAKAADKADLAKRLGVAPA